MALALAPGAVWLALAAACSALAALLHLAVIAGGGAWYRTFGAGEGMARLAEAGSWYPAALTLLIACVLGAWAAYACAGAGLLSRLPMLRTVLVAITAIYLLRALGGFALAAFAPGENGVAFWLWSSLVCLVIGVLHLVGLWQRWAALGAAGN